MMLGLSIGGLVVLAMVLLSREWWRPGRAKGPERRRANIAAYHGRLAEIGRDHAAGLLRSSDSDALKAEQGVQLLSDAQPEAAVPRTPSRGLRWIGLGMVLSAPVVAAIGYWQMGSWRLQQQIVSAQADTPPPEVLAMVDKLAAQLKDDPSDPKGWALLGRSYFMMRSYADAAQAYHEANARNGGKDAATLTDEGEAASFASGSQVPVDAEALFDRALALAPEDPKALWYGGLGDAQTGHYDRARERWTRLEKQDLPASMRGLLERGLQQMTPEALAAAGAAPADTAPAAPSPVRLELQINVSPAVRSRLPDAATLFVYAKAEGGPPMPLAVVRQPVAAWPVDIVLDDSMAMAPTLHLSAFARYIVTARISVTGEAVEHPGDLEGLIHLGRGDANHPSEIIIDRVLP